MAELGAIAQWDGVTYYTLDVSEIPPPVLVPGATAENVDTQVSTLGEVALTPGVGIVIDLPRFDFLDPSIPIYTGDVAGMVYQDNLPVSRRVRVYNRVNGQLLTETMSSPSGQFSMVVSSSGSVYVVALDDDTAPDINALIFDRVIPT